MCVFCLGFFLHALKMEDFLGYLVAFVLMLVLILTIFVLVADQFQTVTLRASFVAKKTPRDDNDGNGNGNVLNQHPMMFFRRGN